METYSKTYDCFVISLVAEKITTFSGPGHVFGFGGRGVRCFEAGNNRRMSNVLVINALNGCKGMRPVHAKNQQGGNQVFFLRYGLVLLRLFIIERITRRYFQNHTTEVL